MEKSNLITCNWSKHKFAKIVPSFPENDPVNKKNYIILDFSGKSLDSDINPDQKNPSAKKSDEIIW